MKFELIKKFFLMDIPQKFIFLVMSKACKSSRTRKMWSIGRRNRKQTNKQKLKCSMYPFTFLTERAEKKIELFPVKEMHWLGFGIVESVRNRASGEEAIEVGRGKLSSCKWCSALERENDETEATRNELNLICWLFVKENVEKQSKP